MFAGGGQCRNDEHWAILIGDKEYALDSIAERLQIEAMAALEPEVDPHSGVRLSAKRVVIRADQSAPSSHVLRIINSCASAKLYKIAVAARAGEVEGQFECWLPRGAPTRDVAVDASSAVEFRVALLWDEVGQKAVRQLGTRKMQSDEELLGLFKQWNDDALRLKKSQALVTIDAAAKVPWNDIVNVINLCAKAHIDKIEFAAWPW